MFSGQEKVQYSVIKSAGEPSPGGEATPSYFEDERGHGDPLFLDRARRRLRPDAGSPASDIYLSVNFGLAQLSPNLNTVSDDSRPIVRHDGREIVFDSNRSSAVVSRLAVKMSSPPKPLADKQAHYVPTFEPAAGPHPCRSTRLKLSNEWLNCFDCCTDC